MMWIFKLFFLLLLRRCCSERKRYIVEFDRFASIEEHYDFIEKKVGRKYWQAVPSIAKEFPRDSIGILAQSEIVKYLDQFVKRISLDSSYHNLKNKTSDSPHKIDIRKYGGTIAPGLSAKKVWQWNNGSKARVAIFDTGLTHGDHPHFIHCDIEERINWTSEPTMFDELGHGTFVSSLIAGHAQECPGSAPGTRILAYKVFTNDQISFTSWFLDAFNYVLYRNDVDIINLSVGGPDFTDLPFVDKVLQLVASGITVVSAMGNDGPTWGTLNSPADMAQVIGVGGTDVFEKGGGISSFSSRGPTRPAKRIKPDLTAPAAGVLGSILSPNQNTQCRAMHGTSVASPSVAGVAALIASATNFKRNPAMIKQCLIETADRIKDVSIFVQGAGRMNTQRAAECGKLYQPRITLFPNRLDLTDCPYFSPFCDQPLTPHTFGGLSFALTVINGIGSTFRVLKYSFQNDQGGLQITLPPKLTHDSFWPWFAEIGITISLTQNIDQSVLITAVLTLTIETRLLGVIETEKPKNDCSTSQHFDIRDISFEIKIPVAPAKERKHRLLWDVGHSLAYPPAFVARDSLRQQSDLLDWFGDEPWTNFRTTFQYLLSQGYEIDILRHDFIHFDATQYGALILVDSEDEFTPDEILKLTHDIRHNNLGLIIFADWHSPQLSQDTSFFDDNTQVRWRTAVGGANIPAINRLIQDFGFGFGDQVFEGHLSDIFGDDIHFDSGNALVKLPKLAYAVTAPNLKRRRSNAQLQDEADSLRRSKNRNKIPLETPQTAPIILAALDRIVTFGDSACIDDAHHIGGFCWPLLDAALLLATSGIRNVTIFPDASQIGARASYQSAPPSTGLVSSYLAKYSTRLRQQREDFSF